MNKVQNVQFGSIYTGKTITDMLAKNPAVKKQYGNLQYLLRQNNLHKTKYTDVILQYDKDGFYGVISSKKEGIPMHPDYRSSEINKKTLNNFKNWLKNWENSFNPEIIKNMRNLTAELIKNK